MRTLRRRVLLTLGFVLVAAWAHAQTPCTNVGTVYACQAGVARGAQFDYSGLVAGDVFRLRVNGTQVGPDVAATNGVIEIAFGPALPVGSYTVLVEAVRGAVVSPSAPVTLTVTPIPQPPPSTPANLRIVEVIMRGLDLAGHELWRHVTTMAVQ